MPIYEYGCSGCGHELEAWQKMSEKPKKVCPKCHARKLERLISNTTFQLKGSGWYVTDYAKKGASAPESEKPKKTKKPAAAKKDD
jgi:putative FmdB family regulatory protein